MLKLQKLLDTKAAVSRIGRLLAQKKLKSEKFVFQFPLSTDGKSFEIGKQNENVMNNLLTSAYSNNKRKDTHE